MLRLQAKPLLKCSCLPCWCSASLRQPNSCSPVPVSTCLAPGVARGKFPPEHRAGKGWLQEKRAGLEGSRGKAVGGTRESVVASPIWSVPYPVKQFLIVLGPRGTQGKHTGYLQRSRCSTLTLKSWTNSCKRVVRAEFKENYWQNI